MKRPYIRVVEVAPRDGLQAVRGSILPTRKKIELVRKLVDNGVRYLDVASFVSPKVTPQLADGAQVLQGVRDLDNVTLTCIVPNERGMLRALESGVNSVSIWVHGSESFSRRNLNMSCAEHMAQNERIAHLAEEAGITLRAYVSGAMYCPVEGRVPSAKVADLTRTLAQLPRVTEVVLADTLGKGTVTEVGETVAAVQQVTPDLPLGLHLHNTYGYALGIAAEAVQRWNITRLESSVAGLGGCPFAGPASLGNVATEDLAGMLHHMGYETGLDVPGLLQTGQWLCDELGIEPQSFLSKVNSKK